MKSLMIGAMALSLVGGMAMTATQASAEVVHKQVVTKPNGTRVVTKTGIGPNGRVTKTTRKMKWNRGQKLSINYRDRRYQVDWRAHHLHQPRPGYQWVQVDGQYVMVALATGLIADAMFGN
jgi:Ni/Co efflux regulator RcnB